MEATTPKLCHVRFWSPKSSSFSGSDSIVVEEAAKKLLSPRPSVNKSGAPNFFFTFIQQYYYVYILLLSCVV